MGPTQKFVWDFTLWYSSSFLSLMSGECQVLFSVYVTLLILLWKHWIHVEPSCEYFSHSFAAALFVINLDPSLPGHVEALFSHHQGLLLWEFFSFKFLGTISNTLSRAFSYRSPITSFLVKETWNPAWINSVSVSESIERTINHTKILILFCLLLICFQLILLLLLFLLHWLFYIWPTFK